jgi:hypothetical protein
MRLKGDLIIAYIVSFNLRTIIGLGNPQPKSSFSKRSKFTWWIGDRAGA